MACFDEDKSYSIPLFLFLFFSFPLQNKYQFKVTSSKTHSSSSTNAVQSQRVCQRHAKYFTCTHFIDKMLKEHEEHSLHSYSITFMRGSLHLPSIFCDLRFLKIFTNLLCNESCIYTSLSLLNKHANAK